MHKKGRKNADKKVISNIKKWLTKGQMKSKLHQNHIAKGNKLNKYNLISTSKDSKAYNTNYIYNTQVNSSK